MSIEDSRAKVRGSTGLAGRPVANATSGNANGYGIDRAGTRKVAGSASSKPASRFAHWNTPEASAALQAFAARAVSADRNRASPVLTATTRGDALSFATAADAAGFVLRAAGRASPAAKPRAVGKPDMNTPAGVAAFILSAGKGATR